MSYLFKLLIAVLAFGAVDVSGWLFNRDPPPPPPTCNVGELHGKLQGDGRCSNSTCFDRCKSMYGEDSQGGLCSPTRENGRTECYCRLTCVTAGCTGDPHCTTFDGVKGWGYQGLEKHYLIRPRKDREFDYFPRFEVRQTNAETASTRSSGLSTVGTIELYVPEWEQRLELRSAGNFRVGLLVNGQPMDIPYRYSDFAEGDYREQFIDVQFAPNTLNRAVLETSFGVRIVFWPGDGWVSIPRHYDLKDKTEGLLGRWNDDPSDDFIDSRGIKRSSYDFFSWDFGDSWCLKPCAKSRQQYEQWMRQQKAQVALFQRDPAKSNRIQSFCRKLQDDAFQQCAKRIGRTILSTEQCYNDLAFASKATDQEDIVCSTLRNYNHMCNLGYRDSQCEASNNREKQATRPPTVRPPGATSVFRSHKHPRRNSSSEHHQSSGGGRFRGNRTDEGSRQHGEGRGNGTGSDHERENGGRGRFNGTRPDGGFGNGGRFNGSRPNGGRRPGQEENQAGGSTHQPWGEQSRGPNGRWNGHNGHSNNGQTRQTDQSSQFSTTQSSILNGQPNNGQTRQTGQSSQMSTTQSSISNGQSSHSQFGQSNQEKDTRNQHNGRDEKHGFGGNGNKQPPPTSGQPTPQNPTESPQPLPKDQNPSTRETAKPKSAEKPPPTQRPPDNEQPEGRHRHPRPQPSDQSPPVQAPETHDREPVRPRPHENPDNEQPESGRRHNWRPRPSEQAPFNPDPAKPETPDREPGPRGHSRLRPPENPAPAPIQAPAAAPKAAPAEKPEPEEKQPERSGGGRGRHHHD